MKTAYPTVRGACTITLYSNIPFDNKYTHHTMISNKFTHNSTSLYTATSSYGEPCERFINREKLVTGYPSYYPKYVKTDEFNFDFTNGLIGRITLELTPAQTNANYMKVVCHAQDVTGGIYYYFITGIQQVNYNTYTLSLELDVLMTYQDEFLEGMKDVPVFTKRKHSHRYTNDGLAPRCNDLRSGEYAFSGVKPNIFYNRYQLHFANNQYKKLENIRWLYLCCSQNMAGIDFSKYSYKFKGIRHPLIMACVPINVHSLTVTDGNTSFTITRTMIENTINSLVGNGDVKGCKISPYPPFPTDGSYTITKVGNDYAITVTGDALTKDANNDYYWENGKTNILLKFSNADTNGAFVIDEEHNGDIDFEELTFTGTLLNSTKPTPYLDRYQDPKLKFNPFRKYLLSSVYSQGNEFFPELIYGNGVYKYEDFPFAGVYTSYIGDYNIFTYQHQITDSIYKIHYRDYKRNNIGLSCMVNYNIPTGTNALDVFNSTQAQSFYQSKVASGISSGLSIAGGVASILVGTLASGVTAGASASMIVGGAGAIAGGVASGVDTIKSTVAKVEDLKNTPDAVNVQGGSYVSDYARGVELPYVIIYECSELVKKQADDFFYNYGYEVARDCYFNTELAYDNNTDNTDDNLFGRTIFNYIQINEDITNKINADIPYIVKQKLSQIFNKGITIWNFFGNYLWSSSSLSDDTSQYPDTWFMKNTKDNTEFSLM